MSRVLFIPKAERLASSERGGMVYRTLNAHHAVVGLPCPRDRILYDPSRAKLPRYLLYLIDKAVLTLQGLRLALRHRVEVVFSETAHHALVGLAIARILGIRCVWDSHGNVRLFAESVGKGRLFTIFAGLLETFLGRRIDALITVSGRDAEAYGRMGVPPSKIHVIPLSLDLSAVETGTVGRSRTEPTNGEVPILLFFGSFKYAPNREALEFIDEAVAPFLERNGLRCRINIAGRDIPDVSFHPFVNVLGFVPDIHATIRETDLCIVPVWRGVGTLTKVLDIMAAGTPSVLSGFAAEGIEGLEGGIHAWIAPSPEEFLQSVSRALDSPERAAAMADAARELIEQRYDWERQIPRLNRIVRGETTDN
ncbi:MAG: glycosyltransferase family 4 protein [Thermoplasmata archaeon]